MTPIKCQHKSSPINVTLSPIKRRGLTPLKESSNRGELNESSISMVEFRKLERKLNDLSISYEDLVKYREKIEYDLDVKSNQLHIKTRKINELIQENNNLVMEIRQERESNEEEFNRWADTKTQLENKIYSLNSAMSSKIEFKNEIHSKNEKDNFEEIENLKNDMTKLKRKIKVLETENGLEIQAKMMIIEELEMMKAKFMDLHDDHEQLKVDYEELVSEYSSFQIDENIEIDESKIPTPTLESSSALGSPINNSLLSSPIDIPKVRQIDCSTTSSDFINPLNIRHSSLSKVIRDVENKSQRQKYSQELMKYEFEIKSLQLQNEKLHSYIGFLLQQINNEEDSISNRIPSSNSINTNATATENEYIEYSDEKNIKSAKQNLKSVLRSASAFPIRPSSFEKEIKYLDKNFPINSRGKNSKHIRNAISSDLQNVESLPMNSKINLQELIENHDTGSVNESFCDSMAYSTDYNQGEVEYLDFGDSDFSFEGDGDDEDDVKNFEEFELNNEPVVGVKKLDRYKKKNFASTDSLNVTFKLNLTPQLNMKKSKMLKTTPQKRLQKLTAVPSYMNIKGNTYEGDEYYHDNILSSKTSIKSLKNHTSNLQLINEIITEGGLKNNVESFRILQDSEGQQQDNHWTGKDIHDNFNDVEFNIEPDQEQSRFEKKNKFSVFTHISEEEEYDDDYNDLSSSEDDEEDDGDATFNISNQEIDMFRIVVLRKMYCPRHSMFQCFCRSTSLVEPGMYYSAVSPVANIKHIIKQHKHKHLQNKHPLRYHRHEQEIGHTKKGLNSASSINDTEESQLHYMDEQDMYVVD
ncbi:hypothetical protein DAMA08_028180 [Martiniozyma asiatica (nom. inval.)]|nr:hypothetical protein DAMA08_028180 [Martiniozyma asiatica]